MGYRRGIFFYLDWAWIVPPLSGSTMEVFHTEMDNTIKTPNYFYRKKPWTL